MESGCLSWSFNLKKIVTKWFQQQNKFITEFKSTQAITLKQCTCLFLWFSDPVPKLRCEDEAKREVALINKELRAVVVKMRENFFKLSVE